MSKTRLAGMPARTLDPSTRVRLPSTVAALVTALVLAWGAPAVAQQAKCLAGKTKCMGKKAGGELKCHELAETPGKPADPNAGGCIDKVVAKFDGGVDPTKGCFAKLESKVPNDCITSGDTATAEAAVDSCVGGLVAAIDPPPITQTKCGAGKKKCVAKYLGALLKCRQLAQSPGKPSDPNAGGCVDKAQAKYNGGLDPTKGCFAKLEAGSGNDCQAPLGNSATLQQDVENCVADLVALETPTTSSTSTSTSTSSTTTCPPPGQTLFGALTATPGRFNYNMQLGIPGANAACMASSACTHACTQSERQSAESAGELVGLKDIQNNTVGSFWAIDASLPALQQCQDDAMNGSLLNWEYGTAHTPSRGVRVDLNNGTGALSAEQPPQQCNFSNHWVGCCQ